jgi:hypothetical protein
VLGHTDARVTLDLYAQVVTEQQQAAADAMAARFLDPTPRDKRGMEAENEGREQAAETTERACEQALSWLSGGGDLNSRPLRPEVESADTRRTDLDESAWSTGRADRCEQVRPKTTARWTRDGPPLAAVRRTG